MSYRVNHLSPVSLVLWALIAVAATAGEPAPTAGKDEPKTASADEPKRTPVEVALASPVEFKFTEQPLKDVAQFIAKTCKINVVLDDKALADAGVSPDTPNTFSAKKLSLRSALTLLLAPRELDFFISHENTLLISTRTICRCATTTRLYDKSTLSPAAFPGNPLAPYHPVDQIQYDSTADLLTKVVAPNTWTANGGSGSISSLGCVEIISQEQEVHDQIESLFSMLRIMVKEPNWAVTHHAASIPDPARAVEDRIQVALEKRGDVDLPKMSLSELRDWIARQIDFNVALDERALADRASQGAIDVGPFKAKQISLDDGLRQLLRPVDLDFILDHESLIITTTQIEPRMILRVYPVADLVAGADETMTGDVAHAIQELVAPQTWADSGGAAVIGDWPEGHAIVVRQTDAAHKQIGQLLTELRAIKVKAEAVVAAAGQKPEPVLAFYPIRNAQPPSPATKNSPRDKQQSGDEPPVSNTDVVEIIDVIRGVIEPGSWKEQLSGSGAPKYYIGRAGRRIVVRQTRGVQQKIARLLEELDVLDKSH